MIVVGVALPNVVVAVLVGAGLVLVPVDVGCPSFPHSVTCSLRKPGIVPSGLGVAIGSWMDPLAVPPVLVKRAEVVVEIAKTGLCLIFWPLCRALLQCRAKFVVGGSRWVI